MRTLRRRGEHAQSSIRGDFKMSSREGKYDSPHMWRRRVIFSGVLIITVLAIVSNLLLPAIKAHADSTVSWTTNGDFSFNKSSKCGATTLTNVSVTGTAYTDSSCSATDADAAIALARGKGTSGSSGAHVIQIASSYDHTVALESDGTVWAWGDNTYGQLGDGTTTNRATPVQVKQNSTTVLGNITKIAVGYGFSIALYGNFGLEAWGNNNHAQLASGTADTGIHPYASFAVNTNASYTATVSSIAAGAYDGLMSLSNGNVYSWGGWNDGNSGYYYTALGTGSSCTHECALTEVKDAAGTGYLSSVSAVAAGYGSAAALKTDGSVWAWGDDSYGTLGDGSMGNVLNYLPIQVKDAPGTGFLSGITSIAIAPGDYSVGGDGGWQGGADTMIARKNDGTVWAWGSNFSGTIGNNTTTAASKPVEVVGSSGSGFLTGITSVAGIAPYAPVSSDVSGAMMALASDGTVYAWGNNGGALSIGNTNALQKLPAHMLYTNGSNVTGVTSLSTNNYLAPGQISLFASNNFVLSPQSSGVQAIYNTGYATSGTAQGFKIDAGVGHRTQWHALNWTTEALPVGTSVSFAARTSNDNSTWSSWTTETTQSTTASTSGSADFSSLPFSRYLEVRATLNASGDLITTPTIDNFSLSYLHDVTSPPTNASAITLTKGSGGSSVASGAWDNVLPYFSWTAGADEGGGSGIKGYCLYLGQDNTANLTTTSGILGASPVTTDSACSYIVATTHLDTSTAGVLASSLTSSSSPYYLLVKPIDNAGNVYSGAAASFSFKYDNTPPTTPSFISAPAGFVSSKNVTVSWPTSGSDAASDATSGLAGLQYRIGPSGTWYGDTHNGNQDISDVLTNDGTYTMDSTIDYPNLNEGNNTIYFRAIDNAGNVSSLYTTAAIKINTSSPSSPQNLTATPTSNTTNSFAFSWQAPATFVGQASGLTYCYTINTLPTSNTCNYTSSTSLTADAYATQPGDNTIYVVAKDESGNVNYSTYASATFTANTSAPGVIRSFDVADISTKATSAWKLALSWDAPTDTGAGVAKYAIYRSTDGTTFSQVATTAGTSYVDSSLAQVTYYYEIKSCDSANNCGALSSVVSKLPTGRYTEPPVLVTNPSVQASTRKASFYWVTDRPSDSRIQYSTRSDLFPPVESLVSTMDNTHNIELDGLEAGTLYYYRVQWTDEDGNIGSSDVSSFMTQPAPIVKNVQVIKTTLNSAIIRFTSVNASRVNLYFGKSDSFGGLQSVNTSNTESTYDIELNGLDDGSTYSYKLTTTDNDGNEYDSRIVNNFTTPPQPRISNLRFQPVDGVPTSTQSITWTTNVPTDTLITYGLDGTNGRDLFTPQLTTDHQMTVSDLQDNSNYFLIAQGHDVDGNLAVSDRQVFKTALDTRPPGISDVQVETSVKGNGSAAQGQIIVSWKTDELSTSQVAYTTGSAANGYTNRTAEDTRLTMDHVVIISNLAISTVYHLQPVSYDEARNRGTDQDQSAIIGRASDSVLDIILNSLHEVFGI